MRAAFTYASIAWLAIHGLAIELHANEKATKNPLVKVWNATARKYGICYGPGYHACPKCQGACQCGGTCGPMHYAPTGHHHVSPGYANGEVMESMPMYEENAIQEHEPTLAAPEPVYVSPADAGIPREYNEPQPKPERKFTPKKEVEQALPKSSDSTSFDALDPESIKGLPSVESPQFAAPKRSNDARLPLPKLPSQQRKEPDSPSDQAPRSTAPAHVSPPETPMFQSQPNFAPPAKAPRNVPATPPIDSQPVPEMGNIPDIQALPPAAAPHSAPTQPARPSPFEANPDDLLVPQDTHLLDSANARQRVPHQPAYRSANRSRAVIFEPLR
ncbi:hypothetical protein Poly24_21760 [Rosistilla carotiformis]|uniref:Filamentous hemagglutinin n=1 Tax=Rosistilla carotiformis TaxID=2528017 RepID=A0A518JSG4_9BACT|nr:hypothetical protein [Rosistilla carotiformis]QDV68467.1 hypothetical protein Poly24_21760 [Rosistilla carotiformis]